MNPAGGRRAWSRHTRLPGLVHTGPTNPMDERNQHASIEIAAAGAAASPPPPPPPPSSSVDDGLSETEQEDDHWAWAQHTRAKAHARAAIMLLLQLAAGVVGVSVLSWRDESWTWAERSVSTWCSHAVALTALSFSCWHATSARRPRVFSHFVHTAVLGIVMLLSLERYGRWGDTIRGAVLVLALVLDWCVTAMFHRRSASRVRYRRQPVRDTWPRLRGAVDWAHMLLTAWLVSPRGWPDEDYLPGHRLVLAVAALPATRAGDLGRATLLSMALRRLLSDSNDALW